MRRLQQTLRNYLRPRRHSALLIVIATAFLVRPLLGESRSAQIIFSIAMVLLMLTALYTTQVDELVGERELLLIQRRRRRIMAWILAVPAIAERLYAIAFPGHRVFVATSLCWLLFFGFVTWILLRSVLKHKEVTSETIAMSMSVYLLLAVTWGMLYLLIFAFQPNAFSLGSAPPSTPDVPPDRQNVIPIFVYFSLTTLSTIGFGDILPVSLQARYAAVAEGITGQFYLAILVARLVGMQMSSQQHTPPR